MMSMMNQKQQQQQQQQQQVCNHPSIQSTLDGLPKQFVASMRTLFDIMDESKTGCVKLSDIETRWREDETKLLPKGVIECLRKVTPPNGMLSFERFCAGLRICLLRNRHSEDKDIPAHVGGHTKSGGTQVNPSTTTTTTVSAAASTNSTTKKVVQTVTPITVTRSRSDDWIGTDSDHHHQGVRTMKIPPSPSGSSNSSVTAASSNSGSQTYRNSGSVTATVRPSISSQHRTVSMPLLGGENSSSSRPTSGTNPAAAAVHATNLGVSSLIGEYGRGGNGGGGGGGGSGVGGRIYRSETRISNLTGVVDPVNSGGGRAGVPNRRGIMTVLHNWHMGMLQDAQRGGTNHKTNDNKVNLDKNAVPADNNADYRNDIDAIQTSIKDNSSTNKGSLRRREPRRHTLANGIDYNMLKRMKQLEQEKDVLLQGLEAVEKARGWYMQQIDAVQEKMKYIGQNTTHMEYSTEAHQERLNFQMAQIFEVNQHLSVLVESSQRGYPLHMNLAVRQPAYFARSTQQMEDSAAMNQLKEQTVSLSSEVGQKNERILQLEREKAALVRELFQARAHSRRESDDNTLM